MKPIYLSILLLIVFVNFATGCKEQKKSEIIKNNGTVTVLNGRDKVDTVKYTCDSCERLGITKQTFDKVVKKASELTKASLKNQLSFIPLSINISIEKDESFYYFKNNKHIDSCMLFTVDYKCIGKNGYGVEDEVKMSQELAVIGDSLHEDFLNEVRLPALSIDKSGSSYIISRQLLLKDIDDDGYFSILPTLTKPYNLIVTASESCVEKSARLTIKFSDETEIDFKNWNDFNCKGVAYFKLIGDDLELFKTKRIAYISFRDDDHIFAAVPANRSDYFMQYANLISK